MLKINFVNNYDELDKVYKPIIKKVFKTNYKIEKRRGRYVINVILVNNEEIHRINKEYRHIDRPTDVISFENGEDNELGDIFISIDKAFEQADEYGHSFNRELGFLTCHGCLHCLGYDHMCDEDREVMEKRQDEIMEKVGLSR